MNLFYNNYNPYNITMITIPTKLPSFLQNFVNFVNVVIVNDVRTCVQAYESRNLEGGSFTFAGFPSTPQAPSVNSLQTTVSGGGSGLGFSVFDLSPTTSHNPAFDITFSLVTECFATALSVGKSISKER